MKVGGRGDMRRRDRQVVALVNLVLLVGIGVIATLATELVPSGHAVTSVLTIASAIGVIAILVWSGVGPRRGLVRDLRDADARYRAMVEELPAVLYVADLGAEATWHYVSPRIQELLGYTAAEWQADTSLWMSHIHPDDRQRVLEDEEFDGRRDIGARSVSEYRMRTRDGREVWIRDEGVVI
ncbi:MAG: PAS domain-containing protein, partial [Chloroflexota bacterium]